MLIPVSKPSITEKEISYARQALESGWVSSKGEYIEAFEDAWSKYNNYSYGVSCNSGTNALFLALRALGVKKGDEVIVPNFTMVATAWAVTYCGATPIFVDCKDDLTIDTSRIEDKITSKTKVILPVHIYGRRCDMEEIMRLSYEYNLFVVEDSAEAHGIKPVGDVACFSFYGNKIITTGEGGMCITNDKRLAEQMKSLRSMAFDTDHTFLHKKIGYNFRMTNIQAAIGLAQVERIDEILQRRKEIEILYDDNLPEKNRMPTRDVLWMYDVFFDEGEIDDVMQALKKENIEYRIFFKPMTFQPMYKQLGEDNNSRSYSERGIYLPTYHELKDEEIKHICKIVKKALLSD